VKKSRKRRKFELNLKKQSQFISVQCFAFSVLRQDEEREFEKTKPICPGTSLRKVFYKREL